MWYMNKRKCNDNDEVGYSPSNNGTPLCPLTTTYTVRSYLSIFILHFTLDRHTHTFLSTFGSFFIKSNYLNLIRYDTRVDE